MYISCQENEFLWQQLAVLNSPALIARLTSPGAVFLRPSWIAVELS